jgi:hypothetical protein
MRLFLVPAPSKAENAAEQGNAEHDIAAIDLRRMLGMAKGITVSLSKRDHWSQKYRGDKKFA